MDEQTYRFTWQGIEIEAVYNPVAWADMAHLEIRSVKPERAPLPITETGYLSDFHEAGTVEANEGSVVEQLIAYLDDAATKPDWQKHLETSRQGKLF